MKSSKLAVMAALALASTGVLAAKGGNGNSMSASTPAATGRVNASANSGLPVGQGKVTANAAHARNATRQDAKRTAQAAKHPNNKVHHPNGPKAA